MLYVTTKSINDVYTANRTLCADFAPDGGLFIPYRMPFYTHKELYPIVENTFPQTVADILNVFFPVHLNGWDIEFAVGKVLKIQSLGQKIHVAELWHNPDLDFTFVFKKLFHAVSGRESDEPTQWFAIALRIAILFGIYGELIREGALEKGQMMDVSVNAQNSAETVAVFYAKQMGLPVGTVIFSCEEDSVIWEFFRRGSVSTSALAEQVDSAQMLERIIYSVFSKEDSAHLREAVQSGGLYRIDAEAVIAMQKETFAAAVGTTRLDIVINSVFHKDNYKMHAHTARSMGGLQDYRASAGESRTAILFSEKAE